MAGCATRRRRVEVAVGEPAGVGKGRPPATTAIRSRRCSMAIRLVKPLVYLSALAVAFGIGTAVGQQKPPTENKGLTTEKTVTLDLGGELEGMQGRQLRLRVLKLAPGG